MLRALVEGGWRINILPAIDGVTMLLRRNVEATGPTLHDALIAATARVAQGK